MSDDLIFDIVRKNTGRGATITDIVNSSGLSRSVVRISLARLEGARKVSYREVGMAKVYFPEVEE